MSVFKQMENAELTVDEIKELVLVLTDVIPKIEARVKHEQLTNKLTENLRANLAAEGNVFIGDIKAKPNHDLSKGLLLLKSSREKLDKFIKVIADV